MSNYTIYHLHSQHSNGTTNIDSITDFHGYVDAAKSFGMKALCFSEHGNIFAWLKKKEYIEKCGMKYLHGIECYLAENLYDEPEISEEICEKIASLPEDEQQAEVDEYIKANKKGTNERYHCVLIAKNYDGVKELNTLVSRSFNRTDGHFHMRPRITFDELFATSDNILVTSACLASVLNKGTPQQKMRYMDFLTRNKNRCWIEIQHHNFQEQIDYNRELYELSMQTGVPLIVGTDTHALNKDHVRGRAMLQKAKGVRFASEDECDFIMHDYDELVECYKKQNSLPMDVIYSALEETNRLADMVEPFTIDYSTKYPKLYADSEKVFREKIEAGIKERGIDKKPNYDEYRKRIEYEYGVFKHNGAIDFMLLEENYKAAMRAKGVRYGYSRGSVSGSIIAYILHITEIDSIKYNLNFERFMNVERVSLADVDTDWYSADRKFVKDYLYGKDGLYCCDIVTFNTIALKGAIKDICRGFYNDNIDHLPANVKAEVDTWDKAQKEKEKEVTKHGGSYTSEPYPKRLQLAIEKHSIHKEVPIDYLKKSDEIIALAEVNETAARNKYKEVFEYVDLVNGVIVSVGNHPAGCVVSPFPVDEWFGTCTTSTDEYPISMLNMKEIDSLNFVKLDILALDNVALIYQTCDAAGIPYATPDNIPPDDQAVWDSIKEDTTMIFQWESQSATAYLRQLFSDETISKIREQNPDFSYMDLLSIGNGAIRPAGESYRDKLSNGEFAKYGNEALDDFMKPTLGWLVYQEQIIEFLHRFCGFTMGEADVVRRCVDKDTLIMMANGTYKRICDISVGDKVVTFDKENSSCINTVECVYDNGFQNCLSVNTEHCNNIVMTKSHKVLTQRGWIQAGDLTLNDYIMTPQKIKSVTDDLRPNQRLSKTDMFLIGAMIGDGCVGGEYFHFTNADKELIEYVKYCINKRLKNDVDCKFYEPYVKGVTVDEIVTLRIASKNYKESCERLFDKYGIRNFAQEKHIPTEIMMYPMDEKLLSLLGGLFSTDAGVISRTKAICYYTTSKQLAYDIRYLLLRLGIYSIIYEESVKGYDYNCYNVNISQVDSLCRFRSTIYQYVIGNNIDNYKIVFSKISENDTYNYLLPKEYIDEVTKSLNNRNISFNSIGLSLRNESATDTKMRKFMNVVYAPKTYELIASEYMPVKVKSIESAGCRHVYDISVDENHNYVANNLIVHNCFAKKTGTESTIPVIENGGYMNDKNGNPMMEHYIKGFIQTMLDDYDVQPDESKEIIKNFLQVIIDASNYLFSKNHADPYSWIGYICGYLRYYYPLEFITSALNIFADKEDKSKEIIRYAKSKGIRISPIKFRHSLSQYGFSKETNEIFKGIASIKYMNSAVADDLYALKDNVYDSFIELLRDIESKTCVNSRQLAILIDLDFFSEFGDANYLSAQVDLYSYFNDKKQFKKDKLVAMNVPLELARQFAGKETEKMFTQFDSAGFINKAIKYLTPNKRTLRDKINAQVQHLGYIDIIGDEYSGMACVTDINTKYSPRLKMYSLKNGTTLDCKIDSKTFRKEPLKKGDILTVLGTKRKPKCKRLEDGTYVNIEGTSELWITKYRKSNI